MDRDVQELVQCHWALSGNCVTALAARCWLDEGCSPTASNPSWPGAHAALCPTCSTWHGQDHGYSISSHIPSCYWLCAAAYFMPQMRLIKYPHYHPYCPSLCHSWSIPMYRGCGHGMQPPRFSGSPSLLGGLRSPLIPEGVYELSSEPTVFSPIFCSSIWECAL